LNRPARPDAFTVPLQGAQVNRAAGKKLFPLCPICDKISTKAKTDMLCAVFHAARCY